MNNDNHTQLNQEDSSSTHLALLIFGLCFQIFGGGHGGGTPGLALVVFFQKINKIHTFSPEIILIVIVEIFLILLFIVSAYMKERDKQLSLYAIGVTTLFLYAIVIMINESYALLPIITGLPLVGSAFVSFRRAGRLGRGFA